MKQQLNPVVVGIILVVVVAAVGLFFWRGSQGPRGPNGGKIVSDVDFSKAEKDPEKFKQGVEDSIRRQLKGGAGR